jgi:predicted DCC family thiol-disulfide oxidoreductase YuxK
MVYLGGMGDWQFKLLYDGQCPFCRREMQWLQKRNRSGRLAFEDISAPGFDASRYGVTQTELMGVMHGVFPDGRIVRKVAAFREAYRLVGLGWLLAPTGWPGVRWIADHFYGWFARNRVAIGNFFGRPNCESGTCSVQPASHANWTRMIFVIIAVFALTGGIELWMGRSLLGPDGKFGLWESDIWSSENSQRFADPYSFSHLVHGMLFYAGLWLAARKLPLRFRLLVALAFEAGWEILENSPFIINRYRETTISLGYVGDSVLNSMSDILMMTLGFVFAWRARPWFTVLAVIVMEVGCAFWIRDNLTLNIIMLIHPVEAIKHWQMVGAPVH